MASFWMENSTNKDRLLLKHQIKSPVSGVRVSTPTSCACNLATIACGRWSFVTNYMEQSGSHFGQFSSWCYETKNNNNSSPWRGPGNIHGFILDGNSYRQGLATAQTPGMSAVSGVRKTTLLLRTCNLATIACCRWRLVTN